jgi:uncharacterized protein (TIGR00369 family)
MTEATQRSLMVDWDDPLATAARAAELSGMDFLRGIVSGEIPPPPIARLFNFALVEVEPGRAVFAGVPGEQHYNPIGVVHGGLAATLIDSATGCAVHTTLPAGARYTTLEVKVNYVRPLTGATGRVLCEAHVVHRGGTVGTAEARLTRESDGKLLAHGTCTCLIMSGGDGDGARR